MIRYGAAEYLLSPLQYGFPNSRTRYYALFTRGGGSGTAVLRTIQYVHVTRDDLSYCASPYVATDALPCCRHGEQSAATHGDYTGVCTQLISACDHILPISCFVINNSQHYNLHDDMLHKRSAWALDVVCPHSCRSCCFTKNYTRLISGAGYVPVVIVIVILLLSLLALYCSRILVYHEYQCQQ